MQSFSVSLSSYQVSHHRQSGRLVKMHLREGSRLRLELVGDRLELSPEPDEVHLERRGRRRVIVGWEDFDAAQAVQEAREEHLDRLAGKRVR